MNHPMIVFSCGYNCVNHIEEHIQSINNQNYSNYVHVLIDDGSTDGTYERLVNYKKTSDRNIGIVKYCDNYGSVAKSFYDNLSNFPISGSGIWFDDLTIQIDSLIVVVVDMDDYLLDPFTLDFINKVYNDTNCWMTHGSFIRKSNATIQGEAYPEKVKKNRDYRTYHRWLCQHLRTFKLELFKSIKEEDLKDESGEWARACCDLAITYPMLEMCSPEKVVFVPSVLYVYNDLNPLNEFRTKKELEQRNMKYFKSRPKYDMLGEIR